MLMSYDGLMRLALAEAELAIPHGDVPVGALVVVEGEVIASRHNERQLTGDPTAHAEVRAMRDACEQLGTWRLGVDPRLRHTFKVQHGVLGNECAQALKSFFMSLRPS